MANRRTHDAQTNDAETPARSRKGMFVGGGMLAVVATAWMLTQLAVPKAPVDAPFRGPFVVGLAQGEEKVQVNLAGGKSYLVMILKAEYEAYDETYAQKRVLDPLYKAQEKDALINVARQKRKDDLDDSVDEEIFKQALLVAVEPLLFPVHVGNPESPTEADRTSGLRPGRKAAEATMRGGFRAHVLRVDAPRKTIMLDDGPSVTFEGNETSLSVPNAAGAFVSLDVTRLEPDFVGEVNVGTFGDLRSIYFDQLLVQ
jgi:flagellar basal body-associated protein FliL